ncbi:hypothetical protein [Pseudomonas sp. H1h]|uniref:hypothetical protein n=1 Tax=Pseudomonas sp. H1h TaxID=1397280 RepID=UPI0012FF2750|nr:hypothetical protein [Pseudomonas sp. H1h]
MTTNRQKSFIATLELDHHDLDILGALYETSILRADTSFSGGFYTGASSKFNDAHLLGRRPHGEVKNAPPMTIYFRCTDDYYHLYIRSHATHTGHCISKDAAGVLGAFLPAGADTSSFSLLSLDNRTITLEDMGHDIQRVRLKARNGEQISAVRRRGAPYSYLAGTNNDGIPFTLRIMERSASFLSDPDEI